MFEFLNSGDPDSLRVRKGYSELELQDVLLDRFAADRAVAEGLEDPRMEIPVSKWFLRGLALAFIASCAFFLFRVGVMQTVDGESFQQKAENNAVRNTPILADRGLIYNSSMYPLVQNAPSFDAVCDKRDLPADPNEREQVFIQVSKIFGISLDDIHARMEQTTDSSFLVGERISHEQLVVAEARKEEMRGCSLAGSTIRNYLDGSLFAHLLGYTAKVSPADLESGKGYLVIDETGKLGLEKTYEDILRGTHGSASQEKDAFGSAKGGELVVNPVPGKSIRLWVNGDFQKEISDSMETVFKDLGVSRGAVVALDPRTGGVLAMVSKPSFDNNGFAGGIQQQDWQNLAGDPASPLFNRAIGGIGYPTGSVIKPLIGLAALEEGIITGTSVIYAPLEICVRNKFSGNDECFRDWTYHGDSDIRRAIAESVNTFFYIVGGGYEKLPGLGPEKILRYLRLFGWGSKTGIDIPGEGGGVLPDISLNTWRLGDTYHLSIGQGAFAITPIQVAYAFTAIANGGTLYKLKVVADVIDEKNGTIEPVAPEVVATNIANARYLDIIRQGMRRTVTAGSATGWLDHLPVEVAAKTGTAQTGRKDKNGKDFLYSWTVAFAPYDHPEIVLVAVVEGVKEGTVSSLPLARDSLAWYFKDKGN